MDKKLWLIEADVLTARFKKIVSYRVRIYAMDAGSAWLEFIKGFPEETMWHFISVREVKRNEART